MVKNFSFNARYKKDYIKKMLLLSLDKKKDRIELALKNIAFLKSGLANGSFKNVGDEPLALARLLRESNLLRILKKECGDGNV